MTEKANTPVTWRGVRIDARTRDALLWAERKSGVTISPSQGSWSDGRLSGSTHKGSGAVDIRTLTLTRKQRVRLVHALKQAGFAAWYRTQAQGFGPHIHAIALGKGPDGTTDVGGTALSTGAKWQAAEFNAGRNGLSNRGKDDTYRPSPRRFSYAKGQPVAR